MNGSKTVLRLVILNAAFFLFACEREAATQVKQTPENSVSTAPDSAAAAQIDSDAIRKILAGARQQIEITRSYDPAYVVLPYPNGDVPPETGVCSDVVIRAFRQAGVDLQKEIHEDMRANFAVYPKKWGLKSPDSNIDHRRVPNLQTFFTRRGKALAATDQAADYRPGDVVAWHLDNRGTTHIGLVSNIWNEKTKRFLIIHNIGGGTNAEDVLFDWKIIGHYRYF